MTSINKLLTSDSRYLIDFLDNHISHKLEYFQKTNLSIESKKLLHKLFESISNVQIDSMLKTSETTIQKGTNYHLIDREIKTYIEGLNLIGKKCEFNIKGHYILVNLFSETDIPASYFKRIYNWLSVALDFSSRQCSQTLSIFIYLTDLEKSVPTTTHSIDRVNVNTGFTFPCRTNNEINIYRKEEWFKVLIHETFHNLGLDFSEQDCSRIDQQVLSLFPVNSEVRLCETYCEMWAEIINLMLIIFETRKKTEDINSLINRTEKILDDERIFSLFQCAKILKHFGISYTQLFEKTDKAHMVRKMRYKEKTPVLSYYIIKSLFMYNVNSFLEWCLANNGLSIRFSDQDINRSLNNYFILIQQNYQNKKYIECIDELCEWFRKQEKNKRSIDIEMKTLRMSLFEV
jgi:hypothetical protein